MLKHSEATRTRIHDGLKKYARIVAQARQHGMNQRDTGDIVKAMLNDMLGFDPFFDVTTEVSVRGPNADHAVVVDGRIKLLLIVKSIGVVPNAAHLARLSGSSAPGYAEWVVLTNADIWICYRLGIGPDRHPEMVYRVSLLDARNVDEKAAAFLLISKEGVQQDALQLHWEQIHALNPRRLARLLVSDELLNVLRRELYRTINFRPDRETLLDVLARHVLQPDLLTPEQAFGGLPRLPQCYAYVGEPNSPQTWKLYYRNPDGTPNPERLLSAVASLETDPRAVGIPGDDIALVKARLRDAYLELGISLEELPPTLR